MEEGMVSFLDCKHGNVQQFTEVCLVCGYNIYTSKEEYLKNLLKQATEAGKPVPATGTVTEKIRALEAELKSPEEDSWTGNW